MSVEFFFKNSLPFNYVVINSHIKNTISKMVVVNAELQITVSKIHGNPRIVTFEEPAQMIPKSLHACHPLVGEHA
jgi:hypothetical protein